MPVMSPLFVAARLVAFSAAMLLCHNAAHAAGPTGWLNDTGQTTCYDGSALVACTSANTGDAATYPRQDARFGRDAAALAKVGGGAAGFDFTRVCMNGTLNCTGAANTGEAPAASDWACTKDNVTNLIWSLESGYGDWITYAQSSLPNATNAAGRCGSSDWRLPTRRELLSILHLGLPTQPMIDGNYFPGMNGYDYWTSDTYATDPSHAWYVEFTDGSFYTQGKFGWAHYVRLVRSGQ